MLFLQVCCYFSLDNVQSNACLVVSRNVITSLFYTLKYDLVIVSYYVVLGWEILTFFCNIKIMK